MPGPFHPNLKQNKLRWKSFFQEEEKNYFQRVNEIFYHPQLPLSPQTFKDETRYL